MHTNSWSTHNFKAEILDKLYISYNVHSMLDIRHMHIVQPEEQTAKHVSIVLQSNTSFSQ
jgi:hypothetical protein